MGHDLSKASEEMAKYVIRGKVRVEIGWIGEGNDGDYDEDDSRDVPLLRFDAYDLVKHKNTLKCTGRYDCCRGGQDTSYCTQLPATLPMEVLKSVCRSIAEHIVDEPHWKRILEELSWMDEKDALRIHKQYQKEKA